MYTIKELGQQGWMSNLYSAIPMHNSSLQLPKQILKIKIKTIFLTIKNKKKKKRRDFISLFYLKKVSKSLEKNNTNYFFMLKINKQQILYKEK